MKFTRIHPYSCSKTPFPLNLIVFTAKKYCFYPRPARAGPQIPIKNPGRAGPGRDFGNGIRAGPGRAQGSPGPGRGQTSPGPGRAENSGPDSNTGTQHHFQALLRSLSIFFAKYRRKNFQNSGIFGFQIGLWVLAGFDTPFLVSGRVSSQLEHRAGSGKSSKIWAGLGFGMEKSTGFLSLVQTLHV